MFGAFYLLMFVPVLFMVGRPLLERLRRRGNRRVSSPEETNQAADLIERLLTDAGFRAEFRRDPASACERFGLTVLASELRGGSGSARRCTRSSCDSRCRAWQA